MFKSQKHVFWQALVLSLIIFNFGVFLGYMLENSRSGKISSLYSESEIDLLDIRILSDIYTLGNVDCNSSIQGNIDFANKVYEEAKLLTRYEEAARITDSIKLQHKKYDLLRTLFWINSINIKEKCKASYHNVVYIYQYNEPSIEINAEQTVMERLLGDLKTKQGDNIMLIPIAGDNNVTAMNVLMQSYNITQLPSVLIDENIKITKLTNVSEIEKYLR